MQRKLNASFITIPPRRQFTRDRIVIHCGLTSERNEKKHSLASRRRMRMKTEYMVYNAVRDVVFKAERQFSLSYRKKRKINEKGLAKKPKMNEHENRD